MSAVVERLLGRRDEARATEPADPKTAVWNRVQLARHLARPRTLALLAEMADEVIELHGDRAFGDDPAIVAGFARIDGRRIAFVGGQKGADTDENIRRNFGMPHPEGYRKSMRVMQLAERFGLPVVTFVDVPGAHPGAESEERGIAEAIARSVALMTRLRTPIVSVITGEGGSGGALAIAVGDIVVALENAVYSVISPEGCASILWRTSDEAATAAAAMRMSASDQHALGVADIVVPEPGEGAHDEPEATADRLRAIIVDRLDALQAAALRVKLPHLDAWSRARQANAERYDRWLAETGLVAQGHVATPTASWRTMYRSIAENMAIGQQETASLCKGSHDTATKKW